MSARDELAFELFVGDNANQPRDSSIQDWIWFKVSGKQQGQVEHYKAMADTVLGLGYSKRETVTEWAAGFPDAAYPYNYHRTREEAQKFVDGMKDVGADMVVMVREVLAAKASEWKPIEGTQP